jgi:serine/threonine-protein kinase
MLTERYRIVSLLGRGGMGEVYKAEDLKLKQVVALKFLPEALALDGGALARFHNEVRITRQISHPNVCRVYDIGEVAGQHFLSMEFIDGEDLSVLLRRIGRLPGDKATEITRQICAGLAAAHENGVLHRDLKPANIMIDGRGKARVTDFGVAVVANELLGREAAAGTPGYMAPEQLAGKEVTQRSDIYSLGLVLYELFTGKRVFEAKSLHELMELHEKSTPPTPSSHVKDIEPLVERVILRCLEKDPQKRPASAIQVAAALPGGDPLAAALAAGETPSPEMVAAAGEKTGLRPAVAIACLVAVIAGLIIIALLGNKVNWQAQLLRENSPDVLAHKARDIINRLGYPDPPADSGFGLNYNNDYLRYVNQNDKSGNRLNQVMKGQPSALFFWYRESPRYLQARTWDSGGWVSSSDPPRDVVGMVNVELDPFGRLLFFRAVPPQMDQTNGAPSAPDWMALFAAAGLDPARFSPTEPKWTPPRFSDARAAWTGVYPDQPDIPLRIEAAAFRGKPVYFQLLAPWNQPQGMQAIQQRNVGSWILLSVILAILLGAVLLARHNFRQGRGDRRGAFRLALFVFVARMLGWLFGSSHVPAQAEVQIFFFLALSQALLFAGIIWLLYFALEPYVRRRWPDRIISWSRLLSGGLRDPLVGRDVLVGILFGIGFSLINLLSEILSRRLGAAPRGVGMTAWLGARYFIAEGFLNQIGGVLFISLAVLFMLFLLRALTRRQWLAAGIYVLIWVVQNSLNPDINPMAGVPSSLFFHLLVVIALLRFGLTTFAIGNFVRVLLGNVPLTTDFSAWYGGYTLAALLAVLALAGYAFHTSLGGQKLFAGNLLDE